MSRIGKFKKDAQDRIRYLIDYSNWLDTTEEIVTPTVTGNVPADSFVLDDVSLDAPKKVVIFYATGGTATKKYVVTMLVTTSLDQIKEDYVTIEVT